MNLWLSLFLLLSSLGCLCANSELRTQTQLVIDGKLLQNIDAVAATYNGLIMVCCGSGFFTFAAEDLNQDFLKSWAIELEQVNEDYARLPKQRVFAAELLMPHTQPPHDELLLIL